MISTIASVISPFTSTSQSFGSSRLHHHQFQEFQPNPSLYSRYGYNESVYGGSAAMLLQTSDPGFDHLVSTFSTSTPIDDSNSTIIRFMDTMEAATNNTNATNSTYLDYPQIPAYIRTTSMVFCIIIMCLGVVGNVMVPIVIMKTKDMRNSTNIFLMNLSIADLMVLLVCTPTVLVEVNTRPETWVLGKEMCLAVPFVELTVAHASVLTILAISFERYYAICEPLKAGYVCTKTRAALICFLAWFVAAVFTSPILSVASYHNEEYYDGSIVPVCLTQADTFWPALFFISTISVFFFIPLAILIILYTIIAKNLMENPGIITQNNKHNTVSGSSVLRYRKQVVMMLGTVVLSFFVCLLPFRALTLWIIIVPPETVMSLGVEGYYILLYFSRIMLYLNSAVNPILYNLMSSKFRDGFLRLLRLNKIKKLQRYHGDTIQRKDTFNTTTSTNYSSSQPTSESFWRRYSSNRHASQKSPQKSSINGSTRKHSQAGIEYQRQQSIKVGDIVSVQNNRRNSMRFVSDVILVPKEDKMDPCIMSANLESYLENSNCGSIDCAEVADDKVRSRDDEELQNGKTIRDGIVVEGLVSTGDKRTHFVKVPLLVSKNATSIPKNYVSQLGKESFV